MRNGMMRQKILAYAAFSMSVSSDEMRSPAINPAWALINPAPPTLSRRAAVFLKNRFAQLGAAFALVKSCQCFFRRLFNTSPRGTMFLPHASKAS
jgi:hypothetical protein